MGSKAINLKRWSVMGLACMLAACGGGGDDMHADSAQAADAQPAQAQNDRVTVGLGTQATAEPGASAQAAAAGTLTVRARGSLAKNVGPVMQLLVNGVSRGSIEVRSLVYTDYDFNVGIVPAGAKIEVVFNNDFYLNGEDRNLFVESISVNGATIASTDASVRFDRGRDAAAFDNVDVLAGLSSLWWNGALRFKAPAPPATAKVTLAIESGTYPTNPSITLSPDRLSVAFGNATNVNCENRVGIYADPEFASPACHKRAVRASAGIKKGEFRYYEGHRLVPPANIGFGYTTAASSIDPYCCFVDQGPASPRTPPSMSINTLGGITVRLVVTGGYYANMTSYYGFAVDYTGADPVVYVVTTDDVGQMMVSRQPTPGFNGADVIPFVYGHTYLTDSPTTPVASVNFGQSAYHYDLNVLRSELALQGANVSLFVPGVGAP